MRVEQEASSNQPGLYKERGVPGTYYVVEENGTVWLVDRTGRWAGRSPWEGEIDPYTQLVGNVTVTEAHDLGIPGSIWGVKEGGYLTIQHLIDRHGISGYGIDGVYRYESPPEQ